MKHKKRKLLVIAAFSAIFAYIFNKLVVKLATKDNNLFSTNSKQYDWKHGNIFYTKHGSGSPILLIHDLDAISSEYEWIKLIRTLEVSHTVYTIDLIGCGRSDKPALKYTNYMYVQLVTSFVKDVIGSQCDVVATNLSASFVIMANTLDNNLFNKIILINPVSLSRLKAIPDKICEIKQLLMSTPLIGTFIYNRMTTPIKIDLVFRTKYFSKSQLITSKIKNTYYESAHLDKSNGKYLLSSILTNYMNLNIIHAVKRINKPIYIIGSRELKNNNEILETYSRLNKNFEIIHVSGSNLYPQLEISDKIIKIIEKNLNK